MRKELKKIKKREEYIIIDVKKILKLKKEKNYNTITNVKIF